MRRQDTRGVSCPPNVAARELDRICVYCGSSPGRDPAYGAAARAMGRTLAERGIGLVYGGGHVGLMGAVADAALAAGGEGVGVLPQALLDRELRHRPPTELRVGGPLPEGKRVMAEASGALRPP